MTISTAPSPPAVAGRFALPVPVQYVLTALAWGASFLFIKVALTGLSPAQVVIGRLATGALVLLVVVAFTRTRLPRDLGSWGHLLVLGLLQCALPFQLFAWAEQHITSAVASVDNATTPLMTMLIASVALPDERPTRRRWAGLVVAFGGVLVLLQPWHAGAGNELVGQLACLGATGSYGAATAYLRRCVLPRGIRPLAIATSQVGLAALVTLLAAPAIGGAHPVHLSLPVLLAVVALGALGTGLAFVFNTTVVIAWGAARASTVTYLTPVVGTVLGVLVLGEPLGWSLLGGGLLILAGLAIVRRG